MRGFEAAATLTTDEWTTLLAGEAYEPGLVAPPLPDAETQRSFVGASGLAAMREAARFYDAAMACIAADGLPLSNIGATLDFGCGWGRIYRLFLRNCRDGDLVGVDVDGSCIEMCQEAMPFGSFVECEQMPPLAFASGTFNLVVAYSVFSHLAEKPFLAWMREFRRLLRPEGRILFTTLKVAHVDVWERLRGDPYYGPALAAAGFNRDDWESGADHGRHLFVPTGGGGVRERSYYGEAIVSQSYLDRSTAGLELEVTAFEDVPEMPQVLVGLRAT